MKINTPALTRRFSKDIMTEHDARLYGPDQNWDMTMQRECKVCNNPYDLGKTNRPGYDPDEPFKPCGACDGTGLDYKFKFGMQDGKPFTVIKQYGLDALADLCKAYREEEISLLERQKRPMQQYFLMAHIHRLELIADGIPVDEYEQTGNMRALAKEMYNRWGQTFMTTNATAF